MSNYTEHYNLKKPLKTESYDVEVANTNNDIIDEKLYSKVDKVAGKGLSSNDFTDGYKKKIDDFTEHEKGDSAYQIAVKNGFEGTEEAWLESLKGEKGDKGDSGNSLPAGGTTGQVLTKKSETYGDVEWSTVEGNEVYIGNEENAPATTKIVIDEDEQGWEDEGEKVKKYTINTILDNSTTEYVTDLPNNCNVTDIKAIIKGNNAILPVPFILADKYLYVSINQINTTPTILVRTNDTWSNFTVEVTIKYEEA